MLNDHVWSTNFPLTANVVNSIIHVKHLTNYFVLICTNVIRCIHRYIHTYLWTDKQFTRSE